MTSEPQRKTGQRAVAAVVVALVGVAFAAGSAVAHDASGSDEHGTITATTDPVECRVQVRADDVDAGAADIHVVDSSAGAVLTTVKASGTPQPDPGSDRFAFTLDVHLTANEAARADQVVLSFQEDGEEHRTRASFGSFDCEAAELAPTCPVVTQVRSENPDDPEVRFTIHVVNATGFRVYRSTEGGPFEFLEQRLNDPVRFGQIPHVDEDVEAGLTYTYRVTSINANGESPGCAENEVTAIPFFGAPLLVGLAAAGSVGTYTVLRRRH